MGLPLVGGPVALVLVRHLAHPALVRLGSGVDVEMFVEFDLLIEALAADVTAVFLHVVWKVAHPLVSPEVGHVVEHFATRLAGKSRVEVESLVSLD